MTATASRCTSPHSRSTLRENGSVMSMAIDDDSRGIPAGRGQAGPQHAVIGLLCYTACAGTAGAVRGQRLDCACFPDQK